MIADLTKPARGRTPPIWPLRSVIPSPPNWGSPAISWIRFPWTKPNRWPATPAIRLFSRVMLTHALNMKAVAKRFCREKGLDLPAGHAAGHPPGHGQFTVPAPKRTHDRCRQSLRGRCVFCRPQRRFAPSCRWRGIFATTICHTRYSKKWFSEQAACSLISVQGFSEDKGQVPGRRGAHHGSGAGHGLPGGQEAGGYASWSTAG